MAAVCLVAVRYRRDAVRSRARLDGFNAQAAQTPYGRVEYTTWGEGDPALLIHGVCGGWDVPPTWRAFMTPGFRGIAPARFGYLGSVMPHNPSPALQADAFVSLLDTLEIERLPVLAFSAGSSSAVQLALRYPERVSALALVCANSPHPEPVRLPPRALAPCIFSQPALWTARNLARTVLRRLAGFPPAFPWDAQADRDETEIFDSFFPVNVRTQGIVFDAYDSNPAIATYPLEQVAVPTLVMHAHDDPLASYADARAMAAKIPNARFVSVARGGHAFMHRDNSALAEVWEFLAKG